MPSFNSHMEKWRKEGMLYLRSNIPELKRFEGFDGFEELDLLSQKDLSQYIENKEVIRSGTNAFSLLVDSKINQQERKIAIKDSILSELNEISKEINEI